MKHSNSSEKEKRMSSHSSHNHQHGHSHGHGHGKGSRRDQNNELKDTALQSQLAIASNEHITPSPIVEETDQEIADIQESERLLTGKSGRHSASSKSRPASVRPGSTRSTFENLPGTRPPSRKVSLVYFNGCQLC
ncbi:hypothetical protein ACJMK2_012850 [Sinanodonta woodiana]|uniref:Uncharacterized protein n=1 Tax=Sinanodonta woodiana TaxID=1069815 RepID=A0ABD3VCH3_SINWO